MTGIVAALEAHDDVGLLRQPVDDFALPLVTPLGADDDNIGHFAGVPFATIYATSMTPGNAFEVPPFPVMRPAQITAGGRSLRGVPSDKGCGLAKQARTGLKRLLRADLTL